LRICPPILRVKLNKEFFIVGSEVLQSVCQALTLPAGNAKQVLPGVCEQETTDTHLDCGMNGLGRLILQLVSSLLRFWQQERVGQGSVFGLHNLPRGKKNKHLEELAT